MKVVYSPGYGAGWSTWNSEYAKELATNKEIVKMVEEGTISEEKVAGILGVDLDECYLSTSGLEIEEIPDGSRFRIVEYDGNEKVEVDDDSYWM